VSAKHKLVPLLFGGWTLRALGPSLLLWLRSDMGVRLYNETTNVGKWADLSGNGADAAQATPADQWEYVNDGSGQAGHPYMSIDASNTESMTGSLASSVTSTNYTLIAALDQAATSIGTVLSTESTKASVPGHVARSGMGELGGYDGLHRVVAGTATGMHIYEWHWTGAAGGTLEVFVDGVSKGTVSPTNTRQLGQSYAIGVLTWAASWYLTGKLYELALLGNSPSASERTAYRAALLDRYEL
jgi:hypothetical protein